MAETKEFSKAEEDNPTSPHHHVVPKEKLSVYNYAITLAVACGTVSAGMVSGVIGLALGQPSFLEYFHFVTTSSVDTALIGTISGVYFVGAIFGTVGSSYTADRWGRKVTLGVTAVISIICSALVAGSVNVAMLMIFRLLGGYATGSFLAIVPAMLSELSPPHFRGLMVGLSSFGNNCGYILSSWASVGFYFVEAGGKQWRIPFALCAFPCLVVLGLLFVIPESPRWLILQGRVSEATAIVGKLHGGSDEQMREFAALEVKQMTRQIEFEQENSVSWWTLLTAKRYRHRTILTILTMMMSQSAGTAVLSTYGPTIYGTLGFGSVTQLCLSAGFNTLGAVAVYLSTLVVDKIGRVRMTIIGMAAQIAVITVVTVLISKYLGSPNRAAASATVSMFWVFNLFYCGLVEGATWIYIAELWPAHLRARGTSLGMFSFLLIDLVYVEASLYAFTTIGYRFYILFIVVGTVSLVAFALLAKETKNKPLEEIAHLFGDALATETLDQMILSEKEQVIMEETVLDVAQ